MGRLFYDRVKVWRLFYERIKVGVIDTDRVSDLSAPPSRLVKDEYGNEIGMNMSSADEVSQTVQHPPQNEFARILTSGGMGLCSVLSPFDGYNH